MNDSPASLSYAQQVSLVLLRTLVGWHFLYEGFVKLWLPGWSREGVPLAGWSSVGYLKSATGPFASFFHALAGSSLLPLLDRAIPIALVLVGLSLLVGFRARLGAFCALGLLALFYAAHIPTAGVQQAGAEGAYLVVNKTLVEAGAVLVLLAFPTERLAGLDLLRARPTPVVPVPLERTP
jgi:thiosulfate dehydrogenase [quinone] large subunit